MLSLYGTECDDCSPLEFGICRHQLEEHEAAIEDAIQDFSRVQQTYLPLGGKLRLNDNVLHAQ